MKKDQKVEQAFICPQCNAPLSPSRFASVTVCAYCGTTVQIADTAPISAAKFQAAFRVWNAPQTYSLASWISLGNHHWALGPQIGQGEIANVYSGQRARWPTELVIIKILRDPQNSDRLEKEWEAVQNLQRSNAPGADGFTNLIPQPVLHGNISAGIYAGKRASIFRAISGFRHTFADVLQAYPNGIAGRASIWVWRRILEVLAFIHTSGMVHGAVLPSHLLLQDNEHGARLIGFDRCETVGAPLQNISPRYAAYYPKDRHLKLHPQLDLVMSARCIAALLGGDVATGRLPSDVPNLLAEVIQRVAQAEHPDRPTENAWAIRGEIGQLSRKIYGPPQFVPIKMPS